jgi:hypothetical protein
VVDPFVVVVLRGFLLLAEGVLDDVLVLGVLEGGVVVEGGGDVDDVAESEVAQRLVEGGLLPVVALLDVEHVVGDVVALVEGREAVVQEQLVGALHFRLLRLLELLNLDGVAADLVLAVGVDVRVEDGEAVQVADVGGDPAQVLNLLLVGNALLEDGLPAALELAEEVEDELVQVADGQFGVLAELLEVVLDDVLGVHVQLVDVGALEVVAELRLLLLGIELVPGGVLAGRDENDGLVEGHQRLHPFPAPHDALP